MKAPASGSGPGCWDAIVIGAGPGGALAALLLSRTHLRVLLVERRRFPRPKVCGGCLNGRAIASLARAGIAGRVRALGAPRVDGMRLHHRGRSASISLPPGLAVSRHALDEALAGAAADAGCEVLTETTAVVMPAGGDPRGSTWHGVALQRGDGRAQIARARAVVVADGLGHSSLRDWPSFKSRVSAASRIGIGGEGRPGAVDLEPGVITMGVARHGYAGAVEVESGRVNVAAAVDPEFLKASGGPAAAVDAIFRDAGVPTSGALDAVDWTGTMPLTRNLASPAAPGLFVIGDAAGYVEPFTGEGMAWAFAGAEAVVPFVARAVESPGVAVERGWGREYARTIGREQRWCRLIAAGLRRPALVMPLVALLRRHPGLAAPVLAHFSPRADPMPERTA